MTTETIDLTAARLKQDFLQVSSEGRLGGSSVLGDLADLAFECCSSTDNNRAVVAVALTALFSHYSEIRSETAVTDEDNFVGRCQQLISDAINFIISGGSERTAVEIAALLARSLSHR
jgi:hypothetical protein